MDGIDLENPDESDDDPVDLDEAGIWREMQRVLKLGGGPDGGNENDAAIYGASDSEPESGKHHCTAST